MDSSEHFKLCMESYNVENERSVLSRTAAGCSSIFACDCHGEQLTTCTTTETTQTRYGVHICSKYQPNPTTSIVVKLSLVQTPIRRMYSTTKSMVRPHIMPRWHVQPQQEYSLYSSASSFASMGAIITHECSSNGHTLLAVIVIVELESVDDQEVA